MQKKLWKPLKSIISTLPMMTGIILLLGIIKEFLTFDRVAALFTQNTVIDTIIGSLAGSIFAGNTMNSYIIARELQAAQVSLYAITAFLVAWVTVGLLQAPLEAKMFGTSFAVKRNVISAVLAIFVALVTVSLWSVL